MKRVIAFIITIVMGTFLCACGGSGGKKQEELASGANVEPKTIEAASEDPLADDVSALESIGQVEVIDGIAYVYVTLPAELAGETTQEEIDSKAGDNYKSGKLNDDGSVTYQMTRKQHQTMMDGIKESIEEACNEMVNDIDTYGITAIEHNDDYTVFKVTVNSGSVSFVTSLSVIAFYSFGGMYGIFSGNPTDNIAVEFYSSDGTLIQTGNSSEVGN